MADIDLTRLVKPLEWTAYGSESFRAESEFGRFEILWGWKSGDVCLEVPSRKFDLTWHKSVADAQAAANADHAARVLAALDQEFLAEIFDVIAEEADGFGYVARARAILAKLEAKP